MATIALREVEDGDFDALFAQMRDPESVAMAAFTAEDPDDRAYFDAHLSRNRSNPRNVLRTITEDGLLVGSISSFVIDGETEITYWVDRAAWGRGVAGRAVAALLELVPTRPLHARAASDNIGSLTVLQRAGFKITGTGIGYAAGRRAEIEETLLLLV
jgi:RimJ/RimL family protein N-acetyltransferase